MNYGRSHIYFPPLYMPRGFYNKAEKKRRDEFCSRMADRLMRAIESGQTLKRVKK